MVSGGPEVDAQLLWAAASPTPDLDAIRDALAAGANGGAVVATAFAGRVGPLLWRSLRAAGVTEALGAAADVLEQDARIQRFVHEMLVPAALERVVPPLLDAGIEPLVYKGPAIAGRYPGPGLRPMDDIDIVVPQHLHAAALRRLIAHGWSVVDDRLGDEHYDTYLVHPEVPDLPIELHWELSVWRERTNSLRGSTLWAARRPAELAGVPAFGLPPELELVALAAHAGKPFHHFSRLIWSVDLAVLAGEALDWIEVDRSARRYRCRTVVAVGLRHARWLGAAVPDDLVELPAGRFRQTTLAPLVEPTWPLVPPDADAIHRLTYALSDSTMRRLGMLVGEITKGARASDIPGRTWTAGHGAIRRLLRRRTD